MSQGGLDESKENVRYFSGFYVNVQQFHCGEILEEDVITKHVHTSLHFEQIFVLLCFVLFLFLLF